MSRGPHQTEDQHSYLIPRELRWELPVEQIILLQAETFVDQSVLRERERGSETETQVDREAAGE